ncbi:Alpha-L-fucosidase 2 [Hibiscus syriacus]|uniref:Alpha-L-fucosidase 2 n=1 Tax=Hibiscus syriacus TaxID=106335 RepID=A0A6A2XFX8_HIBSY|nr:Alpha-L-fucosidase 2 [Hibiscus syriacus]
MECGFWCGNRRRRTLEPHLYGPWRHFQVVESYFQRPCQAWTDAIPIGNGRLGAMVWAALQLKLFSSMWTGVPGDYTNPDAPAALSKVRKLVDNGDYAEATKAAVNPLIYLKAVLNCSFELVHSCYDLNMELEHITTTVYQLLGHFKLEFDDSHIKYTEGSYSRELDLETATAMVKYSVGDTEFTREHFASNPEQVIVTKISGSKPGFLSFTVSLDSKLHHHSQANGQNQILMQGSCLGKRVQPKASANDIPKGIQFAAVLGLQISKGGVVHILYDKKLKVQGSDWAVLLLVASSSYDGPFTKPLDSRKDPVSESLNALKSIKTSSYSDLYARHLDDYQNLFHRVSLQLSKSSKSNLIDGSLEMNKVKSSTKKSYFSKSEDGAVSTAERVKSFQTDEDPSFVELLFQYGRYLLISSRPGTQVSNLQGIWNKDIEPAWEPASSHPLDIFVYEWNKSVTVIAYSIMISQKNCTPHLNINLQMNYWPSLPCNLKECQEPLFDFISSLSINGSKTAKVNYEASGWVAYQVTDIWAKTSSDRGEAVWALWPMGGAWLYTHLWEHFTYTMDKPDDSRAVIRPRVRVITKAGVVLIRTVVTEPRLWESFFLCS